MTLVTALKQTVDQKVPVTEIDRLSIYSLVVVSNLRGPVSKVRKLFWAGLQRQKAYNIYIAPQAAYHSCSSAFCVTDRADVQHRPYAKHVPTDFDLRPNFRLMVSTTVIHVITCSNPSNYMDYYSFTGLKAELAWVADP